MATASVAAVEVASVIERAAGERLDDTFHIEADGQLVAADGLRVMPVIPAAEVGTEAVVADLAQLLQA